MINYELVYTLKFHKVYIYTYRRSNKHHIYAKDKLTYNRFPNKNAQARALMLDIHCIDMSSTNIPNYSYGVCMMKCSSFACRYDLLF